MSDLAIKRLNAGDDDFWPQLDALLAWDSASDERVVTVVRDIIANVRHRGDEALIEYTNRFDRMDAGSMAELEISQVRDRKSVV